MRLYYGEHCVVLVDFLPLGNLSKLQKRKKKRKKILLAQCLSRVPLSPPCSTLPCPNSNAIFFSFLFIGVVVGGDKERVFNIIVADDFYTLQPMKWNFPLFPFTELVCLHIEQ